MHLVAISLEVRAESVLSKWNIKNECMRVVLEQGPPEVLSSIKEMVRIKNGYSFLKP